MPLLDEIAAYLQENAIGTVGTDIFSYRMPESDSGQVPADVVVLFATPGEDTIRTLCKTAPSAAEQPRFQVAVRAAATPTGIATAWARCHTICRLLDKVIGVTLSGVKYTHIQITQWPFQARLDESEHEWIAANGRAVRAIAA